jgi:hypothetical protein
LEFPRQTWNKGFLHQLDKHFEGLELYIPGASNLPVPIYYARYADDILIGIPRTEGMHVQPIKNKLRRTLMRICDQFESSWVEIYAVKIPEKKK